MPLITGKVCVATTFYIRGPRRLMQFSAYWEPVSPAENYADALARAEGFLTDVGPLWAAIASPSHTMEGCHLTQHNGSEYLDAFGNASPVAGNMGTDEEDTMPDLIALIIQKRTALSGPENRGRMFIPGIGETLNTGGLVNPDYASFAQELADYFGADQTQDGVVHHSRHWVRKGVDDLAVITHCRAMRELKTRRDREVQGVNLPVYISV